jgi:hypothetical protein
MRADGTQEFRATAPAKGVGNLAMLPIEVLEFLATPTKEASHTLNRAFGNHGNSPSYRVIELGICSRATGRRISVRPTGLNCGPFWLFAPWPLKAHDMISCHIEICAAFAAFLKEEHLQRALD